ncbi:MAG: hypothetical protein M1303_07345 [Bacteroidetes bacterium]|nr:hypothetical protein [Bacteroidota bacterium]
MNSKSCKPTAYGSSSRTYGLRPRIYDTVGRGIVDRPCPLFPQLRHLSPIGPSGAFRAISLRSTSPFALVAIPTCGDSLTMWFIAHGT